MSSSDPRIECQCGDVSWHVSRPKPLRVLVCHCLECRKQSASAFGTTAIYPAEGMWPPPDHLRTKVGMYQRPSDAGNAVECYFCKNCGVRLLHRIVLPDGTAKPNLSVKGGVIENLDWSEAHHVFTRSAVVAFPPGSDHDGPSNF